MEAQTQRRAWTSGSCGGWPRDRRMSYRICSFLRRTEGCRLADLWGLLCSSSHLTRQLGM